MKVLVADDDRIGLALVSRELSNLGFAVVSASDGLEAWKVFQDEEVQLVITDWMMPGLDGVQLIEKIRQSSRCENVYIILLTSKTHLDDVVMGLESGADDYLSKPFETRELVARLRAGARIINLESKLAEQNRILTINNDRMKRELDAAARVQQSLLPRQPLCFPECHFSWILEPCDELAGDILNVIELERNLVAFYILEVSGHGTTAALSAVSLSRVLVNDSCGNFLGVFGGQHSGFDGFSPAQLMRRLNIWFMASHLEDQFFTMFFGLLDLKALCVKYASGGHCPALLLRETGNIDLLPPTGPLVGLLGEVVFEDRVVHLGKGDCMLLYSDGVIEAEDGADIVFGTSRLMELLRRVRDLPGGEALSDLRAVVVDWCGPEGIRDDVSCLLLQVPRA